MSRSMGLIGLTSGPGLALGQAAWATVAFGWLSASGLIPSVRRRRADRGLVPVLVHAAYGVERLGSYDRLRRRVG